MRRGLLIFQLNRGDILLAFLLLLFGAGLSGCGSLPTPSIAKPIPCTPQESNANIYRVASGLMALTPSTSPSNTATGMTVTLSPEQAMAFLQGTVPSGLPLNSVSPDSYSVLSILVNETKAWSDVQTILLDDSSKAQVVLTFLSPPLIKAIYDSEVSSRGLAAVSIQSVLDEIASREELIFFVTVITNTNNNASLISHNIEIPIHSMIIMNSDDLAIPPLHDDHNLGQPIHSSLEPVFGYVSYPIGMKNGSACSWILNPAYNKKIIITVPGILVDANDKGSFTWMIPYSPLFQTGVHSNSHSISLINPAVVSASVAPPSLMKDLLVTQGMEGNDFWQVYAGFLWKEVMQGIY